MNTRYENTVSEQCKRSRGKIAIAVCSVSMNARYENTGSEQCTRSRGRIAIAVCSISTDMERTVRRIDSRDFGYGKNVLNARRVVRHRPRDATVYAKDVLVNDRRQGQAIKDSVASLPETVAQIVTEAVAALKDEGSLSVVFLPPVHVAGFVVASEQKHLGGERLLHGQQVRTSFEAAEASVDVIAKEQKVSRRQTHAEAPDIVGKEMQIFQITVNIAKHVARALQKYHARFLFQQVFAMFAQFQQVFGKLLRVQVIHVLRGVLKHVENALNGGRDRVTLLALRRDKIVQERDAWQCSRFAQCVRAVP